MKHDTGFGSRWKDDLKDTAPWSPETRRGFAVAAGVTLVMVVIGYGSLWLGVSGRLSPWVALASDGLSAVVTLGAIMRALRLRRRDVEKNRRHGP